MNRRGRKTDETASSTDVVVGAEAEVRGSVEERVFAALAGAFGVSVDDVPSALRMLRANQAAASIAAIPDLEPMQPERYVAAVARLIGTGDLEPERGKLMLYAAQLAMGARRYAPILAPMESQTITHRSISVARGLFPEPPLANSLDTLELPNGIDGPGKNPRQPRLKLT